MQSFRDPFGLEIRYPTPVEAEAINHVIEVLLTYENHSLGSGMAIQLSKHNYLINTSLSGTTRGGYVSILFPHNTVYLNPDLLHHPTGYNFPDYYNTTTVSSTLLGIMVHESMHLMHPNETEAQLSAWCDPVAAGHFPEVMMGVLNSIRLAAGNVSFATDSGVDGASAGNGDK